MQIFGWSERLADIWRYNAGLKVLLFIVKVHIRPASTQ